MNAHTPGPWRLSSTSPEVVLAGRDIVVADTLQSGGTQLSECAANARLIAAAPDLLAALLSMRCEGCGISVGGRDSGCPSCADARAAIAKVRGDK